MATAGNPPETNNDDTALRRVVYMRASDPASPDMVMPIENVMVRLMKRLELDFRNTTVSAHTYSLLIAHLARVIPEKAVKNGDDWSARFVMNAAPEIYEFLHGFTFVVSGGRQYEFVVYREDTHNPAILHPHKIGPKNNA